MEMQETFIFRIDSLTPSTLPMARLAEYLAQLASLYGNESGVHFDRIKKGSALLQVHIDAPVVDKVAHRLHSVGTGTAERDVEKAYGALDHMLRVDGAIGAISRERSGKILDFPGRKATVPDIVTVTQPTTVDGVVIKIGGKDNTIPVTLRDQDGKLINCSVRGEVQAKALSRHYLEAAIRVHGIGKWIRSANGRWEIDSLQIQSYEPLDAAPLDDLFATLRRVPENGWNTIEDPLSAWRKIRSGE